MNEYKFYCKCGHKDDEHELLDEPWDGEGSCTYGKCEKCECEIYDWDRIRAYGEDKT